MKMIHAVVAALSILVCGCAKDTGENKQSEGAEAQFQKPLQANYRLKPDNRFVLAIGEIELFFGLPAQGEVKSSFSGDQWKLERDGKLIGRLPEYPDFNDWMLVLGNVAGECASERPLRMQSGAAPQLCSLVEAKLNRFFVPDLADAARDLDRLWVSGVKHPLMLQLAARALTLLAVQQLDLMGTADRVPAKALAFLAIAERVGGTRLRREECMLSSTLGYSHEANRLADSLSPSDPLRAYAKHEDSLLTALVSLEGSSLEGRYLALLRIAEQHQLPPFLAYGNQWFGNRSLTLPLYKPALELWNFGLTPGIAEALPRLVLLDLAQETGAMPELRRSVGQTRQLSGKALLDLATVVDAAVRSKTSTLVDNFEGGLGILGKRCEGPILDTATFQSYYKGYFFSSFYSLGIHNLDVLSSGEAVAQFADLLGSSHSGIAADLQRWYRDLAASKSGKGDVVTLLQDLSLLRTLGAAPLERTLEEGKKYLAFGDPATCPAVHLLAQRLDTRPADIGLMLNHAWSDLLDPNVTEKLAASLVKISVPLQGDLQAWYANRYDDRRGLQLLLQSPNTDVGEKLKVLEFLRLRKETPPEAIVGEYRALVARFPDDWKAREAFALYLDSLKRYDDERAVVRSWLSRNVETGGLEGVFAHMRIAKSFVAERRYGEAYQVILPVIDSWQGGAMVLAARILDRLGRSREAEILAKRAMERYPDGLSPRLSLAEIYWRSGRNDEAAAQLAHTMYRLSSADWRFEIGESFIEVFRELPEEHAVAAFASLTSQGIDPMMLSQIPEEMRTENLHAMAFALGSRLHVNGLAQVDLLMDCYRDLLVTKGKGVAVAWLRQQVPAQFLAPLSMIAYDQKQFDLLWDFIPPPAKNEDGDFEWLLRAAASLRNDGNGGASVSAHHDALVAHFSDLDSKTPYAVMGKCLMGLEPVEAVCVIMTEPKRVCEGGYYLGLLSQHNGDYAAAARWYRVCVETGLINNGEYRWAHSTLWTWWTTGKSLQHLQEERE